MAGEILTLTLLKRLDKAAYQFGGLEVVGERRNMQIINNKAVDFIPTAIIHKNHIKGSVDKFIADFNKTMNAFHYKLEIR